MNLRLEDALKIILSIQMLVKFLFWMIFINWRNLLLFLQLKLYTFCFSKKLIDLLSFLLLLSSSSFFKKNLPKYSPSIFSFSMGISSDVNIKRAVFSTKTSDSFWPTCNIFLYFCFNRLQSLSISLVSSSSNLKNKICLFHIHLKIHVLLNFPFNKLMNSEVKQLLLKKWCDVPFFRDKVHHKWITFLQNHPFFCSMLLNMLSIEEFSVLLLISKTLNILQLNTLFNKFYINIISVRKPKWISWTVILSIAILSKAGNKEAKSFKFLHIIIQKVFC